MGKNKKVDCPWQHCHNSNRVPFLRLGEQTTMFAHTRSSLRGGFCRPLAHVASYGLEKAASRTAVAIASKQTLSNKSLLLAAAASAAAAAVATTAVIVPSLCEEDRLEGWNDRWATGRVVRS